MLPEDYDAAIDDGPGYSYRYDEADRLTEVTGPDGTRLAWYAYITWCSGVSCRRMPIEGMGWTCMHTVRMIR